MPRQFLIRCVVALLLSIMGTAHAQPQAQWLTRGVLKSLFPGAIYTGPLTGDPPALPVFGPGEQIGYAFSTSEMVDVAGFAGAPFAIAVGLDMQGVITGVEMIQHAEPILDYNNANDSVIRFLGQYAGLDYVGGVKFSVGNRAGDIDGISSATISARAFNHGIIQSARRVAYSRKLRSGDSMSTAADMLRFDPMNWNELIASGAVKSTKIRNESAGPSRNGNTNSGNANSAVTTLYVAMLNPISIGRNLLSRNKYNKHVMSKDSADLTLAVMSDGPYSFVGTEVFETGTFDRIRIEQDNKPYRLVRRPGRYQYLPFLTADGGPPFSNIGVFTVPANSGIKALAPWTVVFGAAGSDANGAPVSEHRLPYQLPERFVLPAVPARATPVAPNESANVGAAWQAQTKNLAILVAALIVLSVILMSIGPLTRRPQLFRWVRAGFLVFTLVWLGWLAGAQLSVLNPMGWGQALATGAGLGMLVNDPLILVLSVFVLFSLVVWGRGIFCGWLCPFGALQELLAGAARRVKIPQLSLSHRTNRALWPVKYVVLVTLIGTVIIAPASLGAAAEIEPFKTAITLKFDRAWPYLLYAVALLIAGLFIERAFCRFLCPLGALLAIGGKLRLRNPLLRRKECGSPCQLCANRCPVQAITPDGKIDMDECFYCLDCQVVYHDEHQCPPLVTMRKHSIKSIDIPVLADKKMGKS